MKVLTFADVAGYIAVSVVPMLINQYFESVIVIQILKEIYGFWSGLELNLEVVWERCDLSFILKTKSSGKFRN